MTVTPLARRLAAEAGIDLSAAARLRPARPHCRARRRHRPRRLRAPPLAEGRSADQIKALYDPASYEEVPLDAMRKTIAARLTQAKQTVPHFYLTADVAIDRLLTAARGSKRRRAEGRGRQARIQAFAQRFHHPGAGARAAARAGGQCGVGGRPYFAIQAFRHRRRGCARRRTDHAGHPQRRNQIAERSSRRK